MTTKQEKIQELKQTAERIGWGVYCSGPDDWKLSPYGGYGDYDKDCFWETLDGALEEVRAHWWHQLAPRVQEQYSRVVPLIEWCGCIIADASSPDWEFPAVTVWHPHGEKRRNRPQEYREGETFRTVEEAIAHVSAQSARH